MSLQLLESTHQYYLNGKELIAVTYAFEKIGITAFSKIPFEIIEPAKIRGDYVHEIAELYGKNLLDESSVEGELIGYLKGIKKFFAENVKTVIEIETPVYDLAWRYAGTPDLIYLNFDNELCLDDFKTPLKIHPATKWQTAAYANAYQKMTKQKIHKRHGVMLRGNGTYFLDHNKNPLRRDFNDFMTILRAALLKIDNKIK